MWIRLRDTAISIIQEVKKAIIGKDDIITKTLMAILSRGHILLEDIPGVGKTTLAMAFSKATQLTWKRTQFTPDTLPSDITGFSMYNRETGASSYMPGAAFCNLYLADEINRTSSKTQSALLEVMEEGRITVDGITREVPKPYTVIATQNPIGSAGTQLLPESQLDRFLIRLSMGYPSPEHEIEILRRREQGNPLDAVKPVAGAKELLAMQEQVEHIYICDEIYRYILNLSLATREHEMIRLGLSPRGSLALCSMSRAAAWLQGREYVVPGDVSFVFRDVATHRIVLSSKARMGGLQVEDILSGILGQVPAPVPKKRSV